MWDALDNRIRNRPVQPRTRQELEIALPDESTLHIINEETLPSIHRYQGWPFDTLNCKFDEKQLLNHLLKRSLMHVSVSSFLLGKKTWIDTICKIIATWCNNHHVKDFTKSCKLKSRG